MSLCRKPASVHCLRNEGPLRGIWTVGAECPAVSDSPSVGGCKKMSGPSRICPQSRLGFVYKMRPLVYKIRLVRLVVSFCRHLACRWIKVKWRLVYKISLVLSCRMKLNSLPNDSSTHEHKSLQIVLRYILYKMLFHTWLIQPQTFTKWDLQLFNYKMTC